MRLSTVILPVHPWGDGQKTWQRAEDLGFHAAYTYDHLSWRSFRDGPWFGALPTLTAAAVVTRSIRLGTLVTSPNFRHPVTLAKELITLDDISDGRITLGIGAGGNGFDATALGQEAWTPRERADRFAEFVPLLDRLLTEGAVTHEGTHYSAHEARNVPGCVQRPRLPFAVAATGPRGMRLAARHGQAWVTTGDPKLFETGTPEQSLAALREQVEKLGKACAEAGRDAEELDKILLTGFTPEGNGLLGSVDAFVDFAGRHAELGFDEIVVHAPIPDSVFAADEAVFERIATEGIAQLNG
ncbi:LLM class flavin-dependent oxidoreductase [Streptomyces sp. TRM76323]|uniref:LLM class flavin-dependent oxidoreductase n=1 Tax=Streptomyces tamarix TaxID=3078565 RepID=A0ABU3QGG8_9ACTN|nr:LLM class flavin-dependent oxidoreductase [Streptomyces tamarix]MDT9681856.1 LLM class flavin-dependent oxidoreductase [Streptomyces tamarix]